ncbi:thiol-disulfide oxidoreductase LTO1 [Macadamia integrifolia]|uniref:thiol-disulfide oxidoreductase LTO1 n=1 Tax=Macadamia integrifolia TaxID=60698 RepID=UPI001C527B5B|nr:thiol-disulfide oxidoreductase LTO1 [Macadamia integrifolia]
MMAVKASFVSISAPPIIYQDRYRYCSPHRGITRTVKFKGAAMILPVKCSTGPTDSEAEEPYRPSWSLSVYKWYAGLGALGFIETGYLTYLKFTNSDAFCPVGGGSCSDILNSDYAFVFGVPLPLIGMVAYGLVALVGLHLSGKSLLSGLGETDGRLILLGSTTSMAAASAYFLYLLSTKFAGASCSYCLMSAVLSFSLFFLTLKEFGLQEIQRMVGLQLVIASAVIAALSISYGTQATQTVSTSSAEIDLPLFTTEIKKESSPLAISLAKHLHSIGAKMYGAFWCSHCLEQKEMFGREAAKVLDYVECFPDGYRRGTKIAKACADAGIEGFPTWVINGQSSQACQGAGSAACTCSAMHVEFLRC